MGVPFQIPGVLRRRDQVLAFVIERIVRTGTSPTLDEIADGLVPRVSKARAQELVEQLVRAGLLQRVPGSVRNLRVCGVDECRIVLLEAMRRLGWSESAPMGDLQQPPTSVQLPLIAPFEDLPDPD